MASVVPRGMALIPARVPTIPRMGLATLTMKVTLSASAADSMISSGTLSPWVGSPRRP
jgi:hypothetical protein